MSDRRKMIPLAGGLLALLALALFFALRSGDGDSNANVADFAKSIDHTKANTPSVPPERLMLGRTGAGKGKG